MVIKICSVKTCLNRSTWDSKFKFFTFPYRNAKNCPERKKLLDTWIEFTGDPALQELPGRTKGDRYFKNKVICEIHFEEKAFFNESHHKLLHFSVPTLHGPNPKPKQDNKKNTSDNASLKQSQKGLIKLKIPLRLDDKVAKNSSATNVKKLSGFFLGKNETHSYFFVPSEKKTLQDHEDEHDPMDSENDCSLNEPQDSENNPTTEDSYVTESRLIPSALLDHTYEKNKLPREASELSQSELFAAIQPNNNEPSNIKVVSKDFHFCGKCHKVFDSFEKFLVHKLLDEQYKMTFQPSSGMPSLWLPRLQEKPPPVQDSDDSGSESDGWEPPMDPSMVCKTCGQYFPDKQRLNLHRHSNQCKDNHPYKCPSCPTSFSSKGWMLKHYYLCRQGSET